MPPNIAAAISCTYPFISLYLKYSSISRYVSHVNWLKGLGLEKKDVNQVINEDDWANFSEYDDYPKQYYQFGLYNKWITRFIKNFGKKNIKIITFEQLISDRLKTLNSCYEFLGVEKVDNLKFIRSNKSKKIIFHNENLEGLYFRNDSHEWETKVRAKTTSYLNDWKITWGGNIQYSRGFVSKSSTNFLKELIYQAFSLIEQGSFMFLAKFVLSINFD